MTVILKWNAKSWKSMKTLLKAKYPFLEENDLAYNADEQFLMEKIASRLKVPVDELRALLLKLKTGAGSEETFAADVAVV